MTTSTKNAADKSPIELAKRAAAFAAVDAHIRPGDKVIGIGSGSTVPYVVERIAALGKAANEGRFFVPTGFQSQNLILDAGLQLGDISAFPELDVTVDGADEVDSDLNLIKGGGACHLREKVIAESAKTFVVVADYRKESKVLGEKYTKGVPVEIVPFASARVLSALRALGSTKAALRMAKEKAGPVVTDNGNFCVDAPFPESMMRDPLALLHQIKFITGVVEVGLFTNLCEAAYFGNEDGTITIQLLDGSKDSHIKVDV